MIDPNLMPATGEGTGRGEGEGEEVKSVVIFLLFELLTFFVCPRVEHLSGNNQANALF